MHVTSVAMKLLFCSNKLSTINVGGRSIVSKINLIHVTLHLIAIMSVSHLWNHCVIQTVLTDVVCVSAH